MSAEKLLDGVRQDILRHCFGPHDGPLASGKYADNKLDLEGIPNSRWLAVRVSALSRVRVLGYDVLPSLIVPVPNGANWLGWNIAMSIGVDTVTLDKDPETRAVSAQPDALGTIEEHKNILIVEDVVNELTTTRKVIDVVGIERVLGVFCIWDRGDQDTRPGIGAKVDALIQEHIPLTLPDDSPYRQYLGE